MAASVVAASLVAASYQQKNLAVYLYLAAWLLSQ